MARSRYGCMVLALACARCYTIVQQGQGMGRAWAGHGQGMGRVSRDTLRHGKGRVSRDTLRHGMGRVSRDTLIGV